MGGVGETEKDGVKYNDCIYVFIVLLSSQHTASLKYLKNIQNT